MKKILLAALLLFPLISFAAKEFVTIATVSNVKIEVEKCADSTVPGVKAGGQSFGDAEVIYGVDKYDIPTQDGVPFHIEIDQCSGGLPPSFRLNGWTLTNQTAQNLGPADVIPDLGGKITNPNPPAPPLNGSVTNPNPPAAGEIDSVDKILKVVDNLTNWMFTAFIAAAVIMVLLAAFTYLRAGGGEETAKAHKMLLYSAVAIAVAILAKGIVNVVKSIVKV